ncbi:hypothetical protein Y88_2803 [Novosphingobium nitrogenifigens DSM 19370]|uniref:Uncharacterized protein n=1 Tax=Novosphingobium nitrogenifigens DSM 19370 TaxID=983920 RepID=F1Z4A3_9SPHN|nr:hypothetical protein Y88_2803 [Novosphingobium nitrogenifigens DSM 19370]
MDGRLRSLFRNAPFPKDRNGNKIEHFNLSVSFRRVDRTDYEAIVRGRSLTSHPAGFPFELGPGRHLFAKAPAQKRQVRPSHAISTSNATLFRPRILPDTMS